MSRNEKILLLLLASVQFTHILDFMIIMPLGNYLMPYFHISTQQFSLIVAAYSYSAFASGIIAAFVIDNFDRKKSLLFGYIGFTIGTLLCGLAPDYKFLIAARILAGLFGGLIGAQVMSIVADTFPYEKRGRAMGYLMAAFSVASVVGVPLSLYVANLISWHAPFIMVAIMGFLLIPFTIKYIPPVRAHLENRKAGHKPAAAFLIIFSRKNALIGLALSALMVFGHFLVVPFINPFMEFNVGFTKNQIPLMYVVGGSATLFSAPFFGKLADRWGKLKVFTLCSLLSLPFVYFITNMPAIAFYYVLIATGIWFVVANGRMIAAQAMVSNIIEPQYRGSFMSLNASFQQLFVGSASFAAGLIVVNDPVTKRIGHYNWVGYLSIAVLAFCIFLGYVLKRSSKTSL
ncbi:MAG TPA: MFS transporter [Flavisolibacter sp.]|jgi:predicted MFS family arabinose efflux permease